MNNQGDPFASQNTSPDVITSLFGKPLPPPPLSAAGKQTAVQNLTLAKANFTADPSLENTIWLGRRLAYLYRFNDAFAVYTDGIGRFPHAHQLYRHRGHRYISTRQFDKALIDFNRAAELAADQPVEIEPDGIPNARNQPTANTHFNIWYHLGLAHYLVGAYPQAAEAYQTCLTNCDNDDSLTATLDWLYMTYQRMGKKAAAAALLEQVHEEMDLIESISYHHRLLMYKGLRSPESLLRPQEATPEDTELALATQGYGVGNWYFYNGDVAQAQKIFEQVLQTSQWTAFGYLAAEVDTLKLTS
jgi:tetratricopeptide (TPR) repeat protein